MIPLQDKHADLGSTLEWRCIADGQPAISYSWVRNAQILNNETMTSAERQRFVIFACFEHEHSHLTICSIYVFQFKFAFFIFSFCRFFINSNVLTINNLEKSDEGMYQCGVTNSHGTRYSAAQLRVLGNDYSPIPPPPSLR